MSSLEGVVGLNNKRSFITGVAATVLAAIIFGSLYLGRDVFVPIALAMLLSFVLAPPVHLVQRLFIPRPLAVITVVLVAFLAIFGLGSIIATQLSDLAGGLPQYQATMRTKIQSLRGASAASRPLERAADMLQDLRKELEKPNGSGPSSALRTPVVGDDVKPVPVEIRQPPSGALESIATLIAPLLHPLTTTGIIVIFVIFILLQREDLRNRVIKLAGSQDIQKTTAALDDAASRLSRLFMTQLAVNAAFGVVIGSGLWIIGVPSPILWGIMAAVLRFVPYIGAFIAAIFPLTLAAAVDPGWSMLLWTGALFLIIEPLVGHVIEPLLYGHSTGLSPFAVIVSATLWTALWGPVGLILATPLTICLVVLGRHVEQLRFLDIMFGDRPPLTPAELFYQRMLAGDPAEAVDKADEFLKEEPLLVYYDEVALGGLKLAQYDVTRGSLDLPRVEGIRESVCELVDHLEDHEDTPPPETPIQDAEVVAAVESVEGSRSSVAIVGKDELLPEWRGEAAVLCVAQRSGLDAAAATMLGQLLVKHGLGVRVAGADAHSTSNIFRLEPAGVAMVCVSSLDNGSLAHMRHTIRRLRRKLPNVKIIAGCWNETRDPTVLKETVKSDFAATTLRGAVELCVAAATEQIVAGDEAHAEAVTQATG